MLFAFSPPFIYAPKCIMHVMAKGVAYVCQQCGNDSPKWAGKCPNCGEWNTMVEMKEPASAKRGKSLKSKKSAPSETVKLKDVKSKTSERIKSGIEELDRVLGGGFVESQAALIAGEPGIGKSTLLLQLSDKLGDIVYVSGEESPSQIKVRAKRLKVSSDSINLLPETDVDTVVTTLEELVKKDKINAVVVDSIQTMFTQDLSGIPGSVGQVRESALRLISFSKANDLILILVGHVTKEGTVAGPSTLAHMVDTVLWFEGEDSHSLRILRTLKNRFGATDEIGVFEMNDVGLVSADTNNLFLSEQELNTPGAVATCVMEGTRPMVIEIQALVIPSKLAIPRRVVHGYDPKRVELIIAVLTKHCRLHMGENDVFVNVAGGLRIKDPAADMAIAASIASSYKNKPISKKVIATGEIGLLGEIRPETMFKRRLTQIKRQGFKNIITSGSHTSVCKALGEITS